MTQETPNVAVIFQGEAAPKKYKATLWDWIKYYAFNLYRKPLVWFKKKELEELSFEIKLSLEHEVLTHLLVNAKMCVECRNAYMSLKPQIYLSQIKLILKNMQCEDHSDIYSDFIRRYEFKFQQSEDIATWINGFKR